MPQLGNWRAVAFLVACALFMENLDGTILTTALPEMARSFGTAAASLSVSVTAYLVTLGVLIPISGWLAEQLGARAVFSTAIGLFTVASGLCALSTNLPELTALRVLQGMGGAMMVPVGRLVVLRATAKQDLIRAIAMLTWPALVAPVIAPAAGGILTTYASWRWIFVINLPLGVIALPLARRLVPDTRGGERRPLDVAGFMLTGAGLAALVYGTQAITSGHVRWIIAGGTLMIGGSVTGLALRHLRWSRTPLLDLGVYRVASLRVAVRGGSLFRLGIGAVPFVLTVQLQDGLGWSAARSGLVVMALFVGNIVIKPFTTPILRRFSFRTVLTASGAGSAATMFACATFGAGTPIALIVTVLIVSGMARSIGFTAYNTIVFADIPSADMSDANTLISTIQQLTIGLGVALGALALRGAIPLDRLFGDDGSGTAPYTVAFVLIGLLPLFSSAAVSSLRPDAGASLEVRRPQRVRV